MFARYGKATELMEDFAEENEADINYLSAQEIENKLKAFCLDGETKPRSQESAPQDEDITDYGAQRVYAIDSKFW